MSRSTGLAPGAEMMALVERLYPICRSITGDGVRETLRLLSEIVPLDIHEVPSGTAVLDWTVPDEWNVTDAWIATLSGERVVDMCDSNLHVLNYSTPVERRRIASGELREHLYTLPERPDWIPYRTSYYNPEWGFCLTHKQLESLTDAEYEICIDATLAPGQLTYGECFIPGESSDEILLSAHVCHPSLANDNLSGLAVAVHLARALANSPRRHSYRILFIPGTIGAITWLARNPDAAARTRAGLTLVCLGDESGFTYKRTFRGDTEIDRAASQVLKSSGRAHELIDFFPYGYDERQFNSPGFRMPVGSLMRGRHGQFPEYHTSADDLSFVRPDSLEDSLKIVFEILGVLEDNRRYRNTQPHAEPQLGKRGIYRALGGQADLADLQLAMLWVLNMSDGDHALLDVSERAQIDFATIRSAADLLMEHGLLVELEERRTPDGGPSSR